MKTNTLRKTLTHSIVILSMGLMGACATGEVTTANTPSSAVTVTDQSTPPGLPPDGSPPMGMMNEEVDHGDFAVLVSEDAAGMIYFSDGDMENAVRISGDVDVTLTDATIIKDGGDGADGDGSNFYGVNAALLATDSAAVSLDGATVTTNAEGANGIFSYGDGTAVQVRNVTIETSGNSSGGVMVAGGGTMYLYDGIIETGGDSSAALRTDRGGGTLTVDGGEYVSHGSGSPAIYSTADVTVRNATLTATGSEAVVVEGHNSVTIEDSHVSGNMVSERAENIQTVMIYQSMSGDAAVGTSSFAMLGGSLTGTTGDLIYVTNTECEIVLNSVALSNADETLLRVVGNDSRTGWGEVGQNGGSCALYAIDQELNGRIVVDEISSLAIDLAEGSDFIGAIDAPDGDVTVSLDETSTWTLTGDSWITALSGARANVSTNGFALYVNGKLAE